MKIKYEIHPMYLDNSTIISFCQTLPLFFDEHGDVIFQKRNTVRKIDLDIDGESIPFVVKEFKKPNIIQKISYMFFKKTKAYKAYHNAIEILKRGFDTPIGVSYIEVWSGLFLQSAYYVSLVNNDAAIGTELTEEADFNRNIARDFGRFVAQLHLNGILHHDLNSGNVLFSLEGDDCHFALIDINRMTFHPKDQEIPLTICYRNMTRFCGNYPLFECVMKAYIEYRQLDDAAQELQHAMDIKLKHDTEWDKRKKFTRFFKCKK